MIPTQTEIGRPIDSRKPHSLPRHFVLLPSNTAAQVSGRLRAMAALCLTAFPSPAWDVHRLCSPTARYAELAVPAGSHHTLSRYREGKKGTANQHNPSSYDAQFNARNSFIAFLPHPLFYIPELEFSENKLL